VVGVIGPERLMMDEDFLEALSWRAICRIKFNFNGNLRIFRGREPDGAGILCFEECMVFFQSRSGGDNIFYGPKNSSAGRGPEGGSEKLRGNCLVSSPIVARGYGLRSCFFW